MNALSRIRDPNIWRVYKATFGLGLAYGIAISLIALFLDARGFDKASIGSLAAWFAAGIVALSIPMGALIRRWTAKAVLATSLLGYAATVSAFPFVHDFAALAALRFLDGAFSVGVWVSAETTLLARSGEDDKALVTSVYAVAIAIGYVLGPVSARLLASWAPLPAGFLGAGAIALGAATYVTFRLEREPASVHGRVEAATPAPRGHTWTILWRIKTSCFATFAYGYFQASVVLFLPLYLVHDKSIAREDTIVIPGFFALGMLLFSSYAGRLGDRFGHLLLMRVLAAIGTLTIASFVLLDSYVAMCIAVFVAGATLASISPISLALQGVVTRAEDYSRATAVYNAFYAVGMLLGPPISSRLFQRFGGGAMLVHLAALWFGFVAFSTIFRRDDPRTVAVLEAIDAGASRST